MRRLVEVVNRTAEILAQACLAVMVVVVFVQVIFRFLIQQPLSWSEEVARYVFVWIIWMGVAAVVREGGHPGMDLIVRRFSPRWQRAAEVAAHLVFTAILITVVATGFGLVWGNMSQPSPAMELPMGIPYAAIPLAAAIMILNIVCTVFFPEKTEGGSMGMWLLAGFLVLILFNMPIAYALTVISGVAILVIPDMPLALIPQRLFTGSDVFILLAVPFFILAGQIMEQGGVAKRVIRVADDSTRFVTGGLGHVTVLANMFFAGISGAAVADTAALGPLSIPMMTHGGFPRDYSTALVAVASVIGIIIPPSIPMVIYGVVTTESITRLFLGGVIPGILIGFALMAVNYYKARKYQWGDRRPFSLRDLLSSLRDGILALIMPGIIVGGILFGVFTPTEAAVVAVVYALGVAVLVFRDLPAAQVPRVLLAAAKSTAVIMYIIAAAGLFAWILTFLQLHTQVYRIMTSISTDRTVLLFLIVVVYLLAGFVMDLGANIIILVPIFMPLVRYLGIDMTHFGLITIISLAVGLITPPVAVCTIVASQISGVPIQQVFRASFPLLGAILVVLILIMFVPDTVLLVPRLLMR